MVGVMGLADVSGRKMRWLCLSNADNEINMIFLNSDRL